MKLIIDIPEETYRATCYGSMLPPDVKNVVNGIKNGISLESIFAEFDIRQRVISMFNGLDGASELKGWHDCIATLMKCIDKEVKEG